MDINYISKKTCEICGRTFEGGRTALYCPECKKVKRHEQMKKYRDKRDTKGFKKIGSAICCEICGSEIIKTSGQKKYCKKCGETRRREEMNKKSMEWYYSKKQKIK